MNKETLKCIDRAFKALEEREELLDKIKADIEKESFSLSGLHYDFDKAITLKDCFAIIDKYKGE